MPSSSAPVRVVRFGVFEADFHSGELRKAGVRVKLHHQPFQVLAMLLDHPGELVTREEIRSRLWPCDTFVDFDHGLNNAVTRLREALGDSANPLRFVETLPRQGYRFIGTINRSAERRSVIEVAPVPVTTQEAGFPPETSKVRRSRYAPILLAVTVLGATFVGFSLHRLTARLFPQTRALKSIRSL